MSDHKKYGTFVATDAVGKQVELKWLVTDIMSPELAAVKRAISDTAAQVQAEVETNFVREYPNAVKQEYFLASCAPLFADGIDNVDWQKVEEQLRVTIKQFYLMDIASFGEQAIKPLLSDVHVVVTAHNKGEATPLGFVMFTVTPAFAQGDVKVIKMVILPEDQQNRELDKLLMSSIFKIMPTTKRLFTGVRPTDLQARKAYAAWGFVPDEHPVFDPNHKMNAEHFALLEYRADMSDMLQKTAEMLIDR